MAPQLAWYEGDVKKQSGMKVLAPRQWRCSAGLGADGGWSMMVAGLGKNSVQVYGYYNGPGASQACNYFPSAYAASPVSTTCKAPAGATITLKSAHLATIETPLRRTAHLIDKGFLYWYPGLANTAEGVDCVLPTTEQQTCQAILGEAETRYGRQLNALAKKYPANTSTPTTTASGSAAPQTMTASIVGANSACLKDVQAQLGSQTPTATDTFDLRRPGNGLTEGAVVAVATNTQSATDGCSISVSFTIRTGLGFFVVMDETAGVSWGPFDSHNLPAAGWTLNLSYGR